MGNLTTANAGIDFGIFDDELYGAMDVFYKRPPTYCLNRDVALAGLPVLNTG